MNKQLHNQGFVVLISVLIVSIIGLAIASSLIALGISSTQTSLSTQQSNQARALADTCAEHALNQLLQDVDYPGNETLTVGQGSCDVLALLGNGKKDRIIQTTGTVGDVLRKVEIDIKEVKDKVKIRTWQEVVDF